MAALGQFNEVSVLENDIKSPLVAAVGEVQLGKEMRNEVVAQLRKGDEMRRGLVMSLDMRLKLECEDPGMLECRDIQQSDHLF